MDEDKYPGEEELVSRAPSIEDLVALCRHLNASGTQYLVVGGFAIRGAGYGRETMDLDLMASACGIDYAEASQDQIIRLIDGVPIPFASPRMLYRMKVNTHREKDRADLLFLRENYPEVLLP